ncbi:MAG TPA: hypothetical protein VNZ05_05310 [Solirubrobacteraceae bacterium]|nr:hypothetical protein [Solirubrobacteraceae bacterium]
MTSHNKRARGRSRKRRRADGTAAGGSGAAGSAPAASSVSSSARAAPSASAKPKRQRQRATPRRGRGGGFADLLPVGQRPTPPWHPLPVSELLILIGGIGALVGLTRGVSHGAAPLIAGLAAVLIGTVEVTLREHLSGYRSHTIVLAVLPVIAIDSAIALLVAPFGTAVELALLALDVVLVTALYKLLRVRFLDARRERVFTQGR